MTLSFWQQRNREPELRCSVAVVGGGIVGCSTAFWLRRLRPDLDVALVERSTLAAGASGRNAGFLLQGASPDYITDRERYGAERARRLWHFTRESREQLFAELRADATRMEATGSLTVAGSPEEDERLQACVSVMRADGASVAYRPPADTNRRIRARGFLGSLYVPSGGVVDPLALVRTLAAESRVPVHDHHEVLSVEEGQGTVVLETPRRRIRADRVVLALNAYLPQLFPELGRYVRPVRAQMLATERATERWLPLPVYSHEGYYYVRQAADGAVLVGGARHLHRDVEVGYVDATTGGLQRDLESYLARHFPRAEGLRTVHRWSGVMGFSPDHLPVLGELPGVAGSYWAGGFTGHGMGYGFRFGRLMAELLVGRSEPDDLDLFTAARFDRKALAAS